MMPIRAEAVALQPVNGSSVIHEEYETIRHSKTKLEVGERRVPRAVKNVARDYEQILARFPGTNRPVRTDNDDEKDNKGERIEQHARRV